MKILALDTATEACSVALLLDDEVHEDFGIMPRQHADRLLGMVDALLARSGLSLDQLDAIAVGRGPGSFTGLRIAIAAAQGLAFGAGLPLIPVSTLEAMALQAWRQYGETQVLACLDARIEEVYWAIYGVEDGQPRLLMPESLDKPENVYWGKEQSLFFAGSGWHYQQRFSSQLIASCHAHGEDVLPRAGDIARLAAQAFRAGRQVSPEGVEPLYLRDKVTHGS